MRSFAVAAVCALAGPRAAAAGAPYDAPHPAATAVAVVQSQLWFLQHDDVAGCFRFASPANKAVTGPLERFEAMIRRSYGSMLEADEYTVNALGPADAGADRVCKAVRIVKGSAALYQWCLARQPASYAACPRCWLTESVMPARSSGSTDAPAAAAAAAAEGEPALGATPRPTEPPLALLRSSTAAPRGSGSGGSGSATGLTWWIAGAVVAAVVLGALVTTGPGRGGRRQTAADGLQQFGYGFDEASIEKVEPTPAKKVAAAGSGCPPDVSAI